MPEKEKTLKFLRDECWHEVIERGDYGGAECINCNGAGSSLELGWFCPTGPDHICHYFSRVDESGNRYIRSINREKIILEDHDGNYESSDYCLFCGQPEERK